MTSQPFPASTPSPLASSTMFRRKKRGGVILHDEPPLLPEPTAVSRQSFSLENLQKVYGHSSKDEKSTDRNIYNTYLNIEPSPTDVSNPPSLDEVFPHSKRHTISNGGSSRESTIENSGSTSFGGRTNNGTATAGTTAGSSRNTWEGIPEEDTLDENVDTDESVPRVMVARVASITKPPGVSQQAQTISAASALPWSFPTPPSRSDRASTLAMLPPMRRHSNFRLSASPWARSAASGSDLDGDSAAVKAHQQQMTIAKHMTLKRGKAPTSFRVMVMGAAGTGKTMWIKSFVESLRGGVNNTWTEEAQDKVQTFGVSRRTGALKPTKRLTSLGGLEITPSKTLLVNAVKDDDQNNATAASDMSNTSSAPPRRRTPSRASVTSAYLSLGSAAPPQKLSLSLIDTPALPHDTTTSPTSATLPIVDEVTSRYLTTLQEEGKLSRLPTVDRQHVHLVLWFIDPREVLDGEWWYRAKESERRDREWKQRTQRGAGVTRESTGSSADTVKAADGARQPTAMEQSSSTSRSTTASGSGSSSFVTVKSSADAGGSRGTTIRRVVSGGGKAAKTSQDVKQEGMTNSFFSTDTEATGEVSHEAKETLTSDADGEGDTDEEDEDDEVYLPTLSPTQKLALRQIIPIVPVMPIIGRSDTLTTRELQSVREGLKRGWRDVMVQLRRGQATANGQSRHEDYALDGDLSSGEEDDDAPRWEWDWLNDGAAADEDAAPFTDHTDPRSLLGINHIVPSPKDLFTSKHWPPAIFSPELESLPSVQAQAVEEEPPFSRAYRQNTLQLLNAKHCDFLLLRCVLLGTHTGGILESSKARYEIWRRKVVSQVRERP